MNCPNCESEMIEIFSKWTCEDCQQRNQTYYTSKTFTPSLFRFLNFPKRKNNANIITQQITTPSGHTSDYNTIIIIPHRRKDIYNITVNITCKDINYKDWHLNYEFMYDNTLNNTTHVKVGILKRVELLRPNTNFTITIKFKLET